MFGLLSCTYHLYLTLHPCSYFSAEHVESRIDAFLDEFGEILRSLTDEDFKSQVNCILLLVSIKSYLLHALRAASPF